MNISSGSLISLTKWLSDYSPSSLPLIIATLNLLRLNIPGLKTAHFRVTCLISYINNKVRKVFRMTYISLKVLNDVLGFANPEEAVRLADVGRAAQC